MSIRMVQHVVHGREHRAPIHGRVMRTQLRKGRLPVCESSLPRNGDKSRRVHTLTVVLLLLRGRHCRVMSRSTLERSVHAVVRGTLALARRGGKCGGGGAGRRRVEVVDENEDRGMLLCRTRARARVALDHALRSKERLDLLAQLGDAVVLLAIARTTWVSS